jgi:hypothetical protein
MDNFRGFDPFGQEIEADETPYANFEAEEIEDNGIETPLSISGDERRMQVRAYNFWTAQLNEKNYPAIEELDPEAVEDFSEYSVLLDFTSGIENPSIQYLGDKLRTECGIGEDITYLDQVPSRSLLSRITDHYLQIIANRAPIGFEAEFVNDRDLTIMYRGILLPYSSDDDTIDFIYGVINWKVAAEADLASNLESEVELALKADIPRNEHVPVWEDSLAYGELESHPALSSLELSLANYQVEETEPDDDSPLADWLDAARTIADTAKNQDARCRETLYRAIGRAYDFSLIAEKNNSDFAELLTDAGLTKQDRSPMTPVVKLIFGAGYDKTRLTEFATALNYAHRNLVPIGGLAAIISGHDGGLKGIIIAERRARKIAKTGLTQSPVLDPRDRLRSARVRDISEFTGGNAEFVILVARRETDGSIAVIGAVEAGKEFTEKAFCKTVI